MTKAEARLADNGSEQTVDRLHRSMSPLVLASAITFSSALVMVRLLPW